MSKDERTFDSEDRLVDFAVRIIAMTEALSKTKAGNHIRCSTSPASNYKNFMIRNFLFDIQ